ncbi:Site-specific DNA recombinase [Modestobacter sp. DSM 44400]|uniref:recombinase family protein n=1 Tax=Modestobacter sp. DSM 44400 TaxID=1550230 RepID=UPI000899EAB4|nr:recombinase family protein [Modestobacter sp. DSM 44400]SDY89531.1 Site-specific DNA recombinase [Modestobacter sp. DSM 44400]
MQTRKARRAGIYCRISVTQPGRDKVGSQERSCRKLAADHKYDVVQVYVDDGISASSGAQRPGWEQMLEDVAAGKLDVLLAVEESRFARQVMAKEQLQLACITGGVRWHTLAEGEVDPASADGQLSSGLRALLARHEVQRKSERQLRANNDRRSRGEPIGGPRIFGFESDRITHRPDEVRELVWAYESIADGGSVYSIARSWNDRAIKTASNYKPGKANDKWSYQSVRQVLLNPRNAAIYTHRGEELPVVAAWEPIVPRELFQAVRALLTDPSRRITDHREPRWLLAGIATCGVCGGYMRSSRGSSRGKTWPVYRCTTKHSLPDDERRHAAITANVLDELARSAVADAFIFGASSETEVVDPDLAEARRLRVRQAELGTELDAAVEQFVRAKSPRGRSAAQRLVDELEAEDLAIREQLDGIERQSARAALLSNTSADLLGRGRVDLAKVAESKARLESSFDGLPLAKRRTLVRELVDVVVNPGRGAGRVDIIHKRVPSLNDDDESASVP